MVQFLFILQLRTVYFYWEQCYNSNADVVARLSGLQTMVQASGCGLEGNEMVSSQFFFGKVR